MLKNKFIGLALALMALVGCAKSLDLSDLEMPNQEFAVPILDMQTSLSKMATKFDDRAFLRIDPDGQLALQYKGTLISKNAIDLFAQFQNVFFPIADTATTLPFNLSSDVRLDSVVLKKGTARSVMFLLGQFVEPLDVTIRIPQMRRNGVVFQWSFRTNIPLLSGNVDSTSLAGYSIVPNNDSIRVFYDARKVSNGERVKINTFFMVMRDFEFGFAKGYLGANTYDVDPDTIRLDLFNRFAADEVWFERPKITGTLFNSFGFPTRGVIRYANILTSSGTILPITGSLVSNGFSVQSPTFQEIGQTKQTTIVIDKTNSNLDSVIASSPVALAYDIDGVTDTTGRVTGFLTDSSRFALNLDVDLPLHLRTRGISFKDTMTVDFSSLNTNIEKGELKIIADNGLPIDLKVQGYLLNAAGGVVDSLFNGQTNLLRSATVVNGEATQAKQQITYVGIDATRRSKWASATKLAMRYEIVTAGNGATSVRLRQAQNVRIRLGLSVVPTK